jgi:FMN phosphatase YigB (HAD superfamily)
MVRLTEAKAPTSDVAGARACGFKAAHIDRYRLPYEDTPFRPQITVKDFHELVGVLCR